MLKITIIISDTESVVGRNYRVGDNSYICDISHGNQWANLYGRCVITTSEPYEKQVYYGWELKHFGPRMRTMIKCIDPKTGFEYEVMYNPSWITD